MNLGEEYVLKKVIRGPITSKKQMGKITKNPFQGAFGSRLELGDDFDSDFEAVFPDFEWILASVWGPCGSLGEDY